MPFTSVKKQSFKRIPSLPRRDGQGKLLPIRVPLFKKEKEGDIVMVPLTVGRINELKNKQVLEIDFDFEKILVEECLALPELSWNEYKALKPGPRYDIYLTMMFECGFDVDSKKDNKKIHVPDDMKTEKRRLYDLLQQDLIYARQCVLLGEYGVDFTNIVKYTRRELDVSIEIIKEMKRTKPGKKQKGSNPSKPKKKR